MYNFCTKCGKEDRSELGVCNDCSMQLQPQFETETNTLPFAEPAPTRDFNEFQTQQFAQQPPTQQIQPHLRPHGLAQTESQCPKCGGAGGVYPKSEISTTGIVYFIIMGSITLFLFVIFFPCAIVPFAMIFLGLLLKDKYFACVNCGQRVT